VSRRRSLVTGGSGFFGTVLVEQLVARGDEVSILDVAAPETVPDGVEVIQVDIRDAAAVRSACDGVDLVFHNVAQVPLAQDPELFWTVNVVGTANLLVGARDAGASKVVATSTSAVYGVPESNPVDERTPAAPLEAYGRAKLEAELLCRDASDAGLDVTIVRPRTILGHGRLGIMSMLFELVAEGAPVPVLGSGDNVYQFVHADDLAGACLLAGDRPGSTSYNIGATVFSTMRSTLESLCDHAGTGARVRSVPRGPARVAMELASRTGVLPLAPYHWLLYGESLYFDTTKAQTELGWQARHTQAAMLAGTYDWWLEHRSTLGDRTGSHHQSPARMGALALLKRWP
jgi:nucleoside-diphosphate-sugar epimerase